MARLSVRLLGLTLGVAAFVCLTATTVLAQSRIEFAPARLVSSVHGTDVYEVYCASCHGPVARGDGPAASLLKRRPPDLTLIEVRDGEFDRLHVMHHCGAVGRDPEEPMPEWDRILASVYGDHNTARFAISNVVMYIETLQRH